MRGIITLLLVLLHTPAVEAGWDYVTNGGNWNEGVCKNPKMKQQSPIDLPDSAPVAKGDFLYFKYPPMGQAIKIYNNGHAIAMTMPEVYKGGFMLGESPDFEAAEKIYRLWQVNFHSPSEHMRNGQRLPLEMQLIHKDVASHQVAGISILFSQGSGANNMLNVLMEYGLPRHAWDEMFINKVATKTKFAATPNTKDIDFSHVVNGSAYYNYIGSQTVPPCEPDMIWYVRQNPVLASQAQLNEFQSVLMGLNPPNGNYREVQPINGRKVVLTPSMNMYDPVFEPVSIPAGTEPKPPPLIKDTDIIGNVNFEEIHACPEKPTPIQTKTCDTPDMVEAKKRVKATLQNAKAARVGALGAEQGYAVAKAGYDAAPGLVEKIDLKWGLIMAKGLYNGALQGRAGAEAAFKAAVENAKKIMTAQALARGEGVDEAQIPPTTQPPPAAIANTTMAPTDFPPEPTILPGKYLAYRPRLKLPRGDAGHPFFPEVAETAPRIGNAPGMQQKVYEKIKASLRQPDGPQGQFPVPELELVTSTTTAPPTTAPPTQAHIILDTAWEVAKKNETGFAVDFRAKMAKTLGVSPDQIEIESVEAAPTTLPPTGPVAATAGQMAGASFLQRVADYGARWRVR